MSRSTEQRDEHLVGNKPHGFAQGLSWERFAA